MPMESALQVGSLHSMGNIWDVYKRKNNQKITSILEDKLPGRLI